jgi:hypothetical protein
MARYKKINEQDVVKVAEDTEDKEAAAEAKKPP